MVLENIKKIESYVSSVVFYNAINNYLLLTVSDED